MTEGPGAGFHAGHLAIFRMPAKDAFELAEPLQLLAWNEPFFGQKQV